MRRPWIKIETCTPDKPEVCSLATQLKMDEDMVVGKLVRLWSWAELNRIQPNDIGVTREFIDKLVGRKGFAAALEKTGWLIEADEKLSFPNFKRHNSPVAQNKALTAKRVARHRQRKAGAQEKETNDSLHERDSSTASAPPEKHQKRKPKSSEQVTAKTLPKASEEALEVVENAVELEQITEVITSDFSFETNEFEVNEAETDLSENVTIPAETPIAEEKPESLPEITPQEALAALQVEEPAPRKKRSKAAVENDDQPMLF